MTAKPKKVAKKAKPKAKKTATKAEKRALFRAYGAALDAIEAAKQEKSRAAKAIHDAVGRGPFIWRGESVHVGTREGTWFLRKDTTIKPERVD